MKNGLSTAPAGSFVPGWASEQDNAALRRLLRDTPMPGSIRVSLECEPNFFNAAVGWERHYTALARDSCSGEVFAMCSRSVRTAFVNGNPVPLGYLSQLRVVPGHQPYKRRLLQMGFEWLGRTREPVEAPFDITTLVEGNSPAHRLLTARLKGLPLYSHIGRMLTFLIPVKILRRIRGGLGVIRGGPELAVPLLQCLERFGRRHQFAPHWKPCDFSTDAPGDCAEQGRVRYADFFLVPNGRRAAGCLALWDQRRFRQVVVRGYAPLVTRLRPLLNVFGAGLPNAGSVLPIAWLSHLAIDDDQPELFKMLIDSVRRHLQQGGSDIRWLALMLAERHPLAPAAKRLASHTYASNLFAVHAPPTKLDLDSRLPHLEGALL